MYVWNVLPALCQIGRLFVSPLATLAFKLCVVGMYVWHLLQMTFQLLKFVV